MKLINANKSFSSIKINYGPLICENDNIKTCQIWPTHWSPNVLFLLKFWKFLKKNEKKVGNCPPIVWISVPAAFSYTEISSPFNIMIIMSKLRPHMERMKKLWKIEKKLKKSRKLEANCLNQVQSAWFTSYKHQSTLIKHLRVLYSILTLKISKMKL